MSIFKNLGEMELIQKKVKCKICQRTRLLIKNRRSARPPIFYAVKAKYLYGKLRAGAMHDIIPAGKKTNLLHKISMKKA